jgi:hypothetical protein
MKSRLVLTSLLGVNRQYVDMSRQMLLYYREWPITEFVLTLNGSDGEIRSFRNFLRDASIPATVFAATERYDNRRQARWSNQRQAYIRRKYTAQDWKLCVDSDEILDRSEVLLQLLDTTLSDYFLAFTVDMVPIAPADESPSGARVFDRPHIKCFLTQVYALAQKVPIARAHVLVGGAAHDVTRRYRSLPRYDHVLPLYHYKWESGVRARLHDRFEHYQQLGLPYAEESQLFCTQLDEGIAHLCVGDLSAVRLAVNRDKTGDLSLQLDPAGHLTFFSPSKVMGGCEIRPSLSELGSSNAVPGIISDSVDNVPNKLKNN